MGGKSTGTGKPKLDPAKEKEFVDALKAGGNFRIAAGKSRISVRTVSRWLQYGLRDLDEWSEQCEDLPDDEPAPDLSLYATFYVNVAEALAVRDLGWIQAIERGGLVDEKGKTQWTHYAWLLERSKPDEFALRDGVRRLEITGAGGGPIQTEVKTLDVLAVLQAAGAVEEAGQGKVAGLEEGNARPRRALPAAQEVLAEPSVGEPAASRVPSSRPA